MKEQALWKIPDVAEYLGVPLSSIYKMTAPKSSLRIPHVRLAGRVRFRKADIDQWLELLTVSKNDILIQAKEGWDPKTDERIIPISPVLHKILSEQRKHRRSEHWVFANKYGNRLSHLLDKLKLICKRAGMRQATLHSLRHSFGAHLRMAGVSLADIADLMGHKDLATTQIYAKVEQQHLRDVVTKLTPLISEQVSLKSVTQELPHRWSARCDVGKKMWF